MSPIVTRIFCVLFCLTLSACVTPPSVDSAPIVATPGIENAPIADPEPTIPTPETAPTESSVDPDEEPVPAPPPPEEPVIELKIGFDQLPYWSRSNPLPALKSFLQTCAVWAR